MNTRQRNDALNTLASFALNEHDEFLYGLIPAFEVIADRELIDHPTFDDDCDSFAREAQWLAKLADGTMCPFDIDERLGNNDADYLTAVEIQTRRVDDARFVVLHGHVRACADCQRTTSNYHPAMPTYLYCAEHQQARDEKDTLPARLVAVGS